ncbi:MAG: hypothetical protein ACOC2F_00430 [Bacteroidota bacterium]
MKKLIDAATELNKEMGLEPAIPTDANEGVLKEGILEAAAYIEPDDAISKETLATIEELKGTKPKAKPTTKKPAPAEKKAPVKKSAAKKPAATKEKAHAKEEKPVKEEPVKKEAEKKAPVKKEKSNKSIIYEAWKGGETSIQVLSKMVDNMVKESTIKAWLGAWKKNKNLPAIAKK